MSSRSLEWSSETLENSLGDDPSLLLTEVGYGYCRTFVHVLPSEYGQLNWWLAGCAAADVVFLLEQMDTARSNDEDNSETWVSLRRIVIASIKLRHDYAKIAIWYQAEAEPPEWVWNEAPSKQCKPGKRAGRGKSFSHLRKSRRTCPVTRTSFAKYRSAERAIEECIKPAWQPAARLRNAEPIFADTVGQVHLFSANEACELWQEAKCGTQHEVREYIHGRIKYLMQGGTRRGTARAPSTEQLDQLRRSFPNAGELIDIVDRAAALSRLTAGNVFSMPPTLIAGEPGLGKTAVVQAIAKCINTPYERIDIGAISTGSEIFGTSMTWATGRTGMVFNRLASSAFINPVFMLDELDKASGHYKAPVVPPLLALLEKETSTCFRDEAVQIGLNASRVIWIATANDLDKISEPLLSRMNVVNVYRPEGEDAVTVAAEIYRSIRSAEPWGTVFPAELDRAVLLRLASWTPREMSRYIRHAFGEAARCGRLYLRAEDISIKVIGGPKKFGFI